MTLLPAVLWEISAVFPPAWRMGRQVQILLTAVGMVHRWEASRFLRTLWDMREPEFLLRMVFSCICQVTGMCTM